MACTSASARSARPPAGRSADGSYAHSSHRTRPCSPRPSAGRQGAGSDLSGCLPSGGPSPHSPPSPSCCPHSPPPCSSPSPGRSPSCSSSSQPLHTSSLHPLRDILPPSAYFPTVQSGPPCLRPLLLRQLEQFVLLLRLDLGEDQLLDL